MRNGTFYECLLKIWIAMLLDGEITEPSEAFALLDEICSARGMGRVA